MTTFPAAGHITNAARTEGEVKTDLDNWLAATKQLPGGDTETQLTIAAGAVTATLACHAIETEGGAASDDLATIAQTNHPDGRFLFIHMANDAHVVTIKHAAGGAGQITLAQGVDKVLKNTKDWVLLKRTGTLWEEVMTAGADVPTGTLIPFGGASAPAGFLLCDGAALSRATYAPLFTVIGTVYGSSDANTFRLPDTLGRIPLGAGAGSGLTVRARGDKAGAESVNIDHQHYKQYWTQPDYSQTGNDQSHGEPFLLGSAYGHQHYCAGWTGAAASPGNILYPMNPFVCLQMLIKT